jgi:hypothetical protein
MVAHLTRVFDGNIRSYMLGSRLWLTAFDDASTMVARETHPGYFLHDGWIELIDEPKARVNMGVRRIDIALRDSSDEVRVIWSMRYDSDGKLQDAYELTAESSRAISLAEQLAGRLRWVIAPG